MGCGKNISTIKKVLSLRRRKAVAAATARALFFIERRQSDTETCMDKDNVPERYGGLKYGTAEISRVGRENH